MTTISTSSAIQSQLIKSKSVISPAMLGWRHPRKVAYIHRHPQLNGQCLYFWDHNEKAAIPTESQNLIFLLEDIYVEQRGEFQANKLVIDVDLGIDGRLRLITGFSTACAKTLMGSIAALSPGLLNRPMSLRLRPGTSQGVVLPAIYVDNEWVDGRPMSRDEHGQLLPAVDLLIEVQTLLRHALRVELLPHQVRQQIREAVS